MTAEINYHELSASVDRLLDRSVDWSMNLSSTGSLPRGPQCQSWARQAPRKSGRSWVFELALAASQVYMIRKQRHFSNPGTLRIGYGVPHDDFNHYTIWHVQENLFLMQLSASQSCLHSLAVSLPSSQPAGIAPFSSWPYLSLAFILSLRVPCRFME